MYLGLIRSLSRSLQVGCGAAGKRGRWSPWTWFGPKRQQSSAIPNNSSTRWKDYRSHSHRLLELQHCGRRSSGDDTEQPAGRGSGSPPTFWSARTPWWRRIDCSREIAVSIVDTSRVCESWIPRRPSSRSARAPTLKTKGPLDAAPFDDCMSGRFNSRRST